ncbi:MAG: FAD-binding oxidoreductase [Cyclobacteriaceae bacterium]|nr:FAD-binding oxidoreductase [Cyclobacteriaceae bacterium]
MTHRTDYIIVGQGLAGSSLAFELLQRGKSVVVYDEPMKNRASVISAGICNPITGKVMTTTYAAHLLFPFLHQWYAGAERIIGRKFFHPMPLYRPFLSQQELEQWKMKALQEPVRMFIRKIHETSSAGEMLNDPWGGLELDLAGYLDVKGWVDAVRSLLRDRGMYREQSFDEGEVRVTEEVCYQDVRASRIIFCHGLAARQSPWFGYLPIRPLKGETLTVRLALPAGRIISRGVYVVPAKTPGEFVIGSTYQHEPFPAGNSPEGKALLMERLAAVVRVAAEPIHQDWGIRPTVTDRRPLMGGHPREERVVIFNGLGTKGVSLAPYFASRLADWMEGINALPDEVNISRFKPLYSN